MQNFIVHASFNFSRNIFGILLTFWLAWRLYIRHTAFKRSGNIIQNQTKETKFKVTVEVPCILKSHLSMNLLKARGHKPNSCPYFWEFALLMLNWVSLLVFYVMCNDISVIYVTAQMCRRTEAELVMAFFFLLDLFFYGAVDDYSHLCDCTSTCKRAEEVWTAVGLFEIGLGAWEILPPGKYCFWNQV